MGSTYAPDALEGVVSRYLDALAGANLALRKGERDNCRNLLRYLRRVGEGLSPGTAEPWLTGEGSLTRNARKRRAATLRRLVALAGGPEADLVADWLDQNRGRLVGRGGGGTQEKVVMLREPESEEEIAKRYTTEARDYHTKGAPTRARALARRALRLDPICLEAHALLGILALEDQRPDAALRQFRQALVLSSDPTGRTVDGVAQILNGLGRTLLSVSCYEEAYEVYRRLRHASQEWNDLCLPILGTASLMLEKPDEASEWYSRSTPLMQYNTLLARLLADDRNRRLVGIALCRGLLANPFVPSALIADAEPRFRELFDDKERARLDTEARRFAADHDEIWKRWDGPLETFRTLWDSPAIRSFLMRALPVAAKNPASPRLPVLIHQTAQKLEETDLV